MTVEEHDELVTEIKHLGHIPKPIVLRKNESGYQIVDGEQSYTAVLELGWSELPMGSYELIEADDFEAMRQTYKRNQHGKHDKYLEGLLFQRMMTEKGLSQRQLADETEVSEGTVRNALEYVKAIEVRNSYADWKFRDLKETIAKLSVRDVRAVNEMPLELGDLWLNSGAKAEDLPGPGWYAGYNEKLAVLIPLFRVSSCHAAINKMHEVAKSLRLWGYYQRVWKGNGEVREWTGGLMLDVNDALPYVKLLLKTRWSINVGDDLWGLRSILESISRPTGDKAKIVLPLENLEAWIQYPEGMSIGDFEKKLREATNELADPQPEDLALWRDQLHKYGPAVLKNKGLSVTQAYKLWQGLRTYEEDHIKKEILDQALTRAIAEIKPESEADKVFDTIVRELTGEEKIDDWLNSLGDKAAMLSRVKKLLVKETERSAIFAGMFAGMMGIENGPAKKRMDMILKNIQPMLNRLATLQEPELALILAMMTGQDCLKIWTTALGLKFEATQAQNEVKDAI
jgi:hypothetical protein